MQNAEGKNITPCSEPYIRESDTPGRGSGIPFNLLRDTYEFWLDPEVQSSRTNEVLMDLGETLFRLVDLELWPVFELLIDVLQRFHIVLRELHTLPHILWRVSTLNGLHVEINFT